MTDPVTDPAAKDPRIDLARERTALAHDRTTLAWIRTALTFATFGLGMIGFFRTLAQSSHDPHAAELHRFAVQLGVALLVTGLVSLLVAAAAHVRALGRLRRGEPPALDALPLAVGVAVLVALCCLYGLWVFMR